MRRIRIDQAMCLLSSVEVECFSIWLDWIALFLPGRQAALKELHPEKI